MIIDEIFAIIIFYFIICEIEDRKGYGRAIVFGLNGREVQNTLVQIEKTSLDTLAS